MYTRIYASLQPFLVVLQLLRRVPVDVRDLDEGIEGIVTAGIETENETTIEGLRGTRREREMIGLPGVLDDQDCPLRKKSGYVIRV